MGTDSRKEEDESALTSTGLLMEGLGRRSLWLEFIQGGQVSPNQSGPRLPAVRWDC
jgi:hypothetical protein